MNENLFEFQISLTSYQKTIINKFLVGPELLLELLKKEENKPSNNSEIKLFLLKNKVKLYPYISDYLHNDLDVLVNIVNKIINSKNKVHRLDFIGNCSISNDNKLYFPVKQLGLIELANFSVFTTWKNKTKGRRYYEDFSIIKKDSNFFVEIEIEKQRENVNPKSITKTKKNVEIEKQKEIVSPKSITKKKKVKKQNTCVVTSTISDSTLSFSERKVKNAVSLANSFSLRRSSVKIYQGGGSIWTVSGGLPSLGKRN